VGPELDSGFGGSGVCGGKGTSAEEAVALEHEDPEAYAGDKEDEEDREDSPLGFDGELVGVEVGLKVGVAEDVAHADHRDHHQGQEA